MGFKKILAAGLICSGIFTTFSLFSQSGESNVASNAFVQGAKAFGAGEWMSSIFLLRKAVSYTENNNAETWYMLITAEMYAGEYKNAFQDCESYLVNFSDSPYVSYVIYHKGRALFCLGEYEKSVMCLSDFCHQYPNHEMYPSALYWIAESFFASYNYDEAKLLYLAVVNDYPMDAKAVASQYRIDTISQSSREEKLLYLLKETGEEYLAAKEEYERQLKYSGAESAAEARRRILDLQRQNGDLERQIQDYQHEISELKSQLEVEVEKNSDIKRENDTMLSELKKKALITEELLKIKKASGDVK